MLDATSREPYSDLRLKPKTNQPSSDLILMNRTGLESQLARQAPANCWRRLLTPRKTLPLNTEYELTNES
jgi:hypothetical protein